MITCTLLPLVLAFPELSADNSIFKFLLDATDAIFAFHIIVSFFMAYDLETSIIVDDIKIIAIHYIKGWLVIDLISIFPIDIILEKTLIQDNSRY